MLEMACAEFETLRAYIHEEFKIAPGASVPK
jgi:hypothetical protein